MSNTSEKGPGSNPERMDASIAAEQFTEKREYVKYYGKQLGRHEIMYWNEVKTTQLFTKAEFLKTNPEPIWMVLWNENEKNELISKSEFFKAKPTLHNINRWNKNERNECITLHEPYNDPERLAKELTKEKYLEYWGKELDGFAMIIFNEHNNTKRFTLKEFLATNPSPSLMLDWTENKKNTPVPKNTFVASKPSNKLINRWNTLSKHREEIVSIEIKRKDPYREVPYKSRLYKK